MVWEARYLLVVKRLNRPRVATLALLRCYNPAPQKRAL